MTHTRYIPPAAGQRVARLLTEVFAPAPLSLVALSVAAWRDSPTLAEALRWAGLSLLFVTALPFAYLLWQIRRGRVTDMHVRLREQRVAIMLVFLSTWLAGLALLIWLGAPHPLVATIAAGICTLVVVGAITTRWKISVHLGVAAGILAVFAQIFGPVLLLLAPLLPALGWARVALRDHTPAQVIGGACIGAIIGGSSFALIVALL